MKIWNSIIIGLAIILGLAAFGISLKTPEMIRDCRAYQMQMKMMEMEPQKIELDDQVLLYLPRVSYQGLHVDINYEFYYYVSNERKLIQVPMTK